MSSCSNRQYTTTEAGKPDQVHTVGPVSNTNGTLSATTTQEGANGWTCQRALTAAKDVAIDVEACTKSDTPCPAPRSTSRSRSPPKYPLKWAAGERDAGAFASNREIQAA